MQGICSYISETNNISRNLVFGGLCIVIYSYNKTEMHEFLKFIFGIELYTFQTGFLSIIRSLELHTQQQVYVIQQSA